jgi:hypothetical protein
LDGSRAQYWSDENAFTHRSTCSPVVRSSSNRSSNMKVELFNSHFENFIFLNS